MVFYPTAEIIADSINVETGDRLTTFVLEYHRFIHSEFMTYRVFSRNASSSRAIPVDKMIDRVLSKEVEPLHWGKNQKGMQARAVLDEDEREKARDAWDNARYQAVIHAREMVKIGVHKQIVNRLLEPFSTITVVCTATNYENFFEQRCHPDAQPEIQMLAAEMKFVYTASFPKKLNPGDWHLPFFNPENDSHLSLSQRLKVCTGRSARVSYLNHAGVRHENDDVRLHDDLLDSTPKHLSPFEHCAVAAASPGKYANLSGWKHYRYLLENDWRLDSFK
ncbi:MAG: FAD-dependent thymidylate synthase [Nostoc sp.]|uniref:FAD-dependent thymidylate synthase n=1 Tax=Nostoc sp. TaxID=1180 RepID=UPI002FF314EA